LSIDNNLSNILGKVLSFQLKNDTTFEWGFNVFGSNPEIKGFVSQIKQQTTDYS
jgi:hypothetical protein